MGERLPEKEQAEDSIASGDTMPYKHCGDVPDFQSGEQGSTPW